MSDAQVTSAVKPRFTLPANTIRYLGGVSRITLTRIFTVPHAKVHCGFAHQVEHTSIAVVSFRPPYYEFEIPGLALNRLSATPTSGDKTAPDLIKAFLSRDSIGIRYATRDAAYKRLHESRLCFGGVDRNLALRIFGDEDASWQAAFVNPEARVLAPKKDALRVAHRIRHDDVKKNGLLALLQQSHAARGYVKEVVNSEALASDAGNGTTTAEYYLERPLAKEADTERAKKLVAYLDDFLRRGQAAFVASNGRYEETFSVGYLTVELANGLSPADLFTSLSILQRQIMQMVRP